MTTSSTSTSRPTTTSTSSTSTTSTSLPNQAPVANAGPDRTGTVNVALTFDGGGSSDPDGSISVYWWQFGDGGSASVGTSTVAHTYATTGTFTVSLWVQDNKGKWSTAGDSAIATIGTGTTTTTIAGPTTSTSSTSTSTTTSTSRASTTSSPVATTTSTTNPNQPPVANAGPNQATQTLTSITLNGSGSSDPDGVIVSASWTFGDGTTGSGLTVNHSYAIAGTYTATLTVVDDRGASNADSAVVTVANRPPTANAGPDAGALPNVSVGLNGSQSSDADGSIVTWAWAFGDGTTGTGPTPSHTYAAPGTYVARLTVTDNNGAAASDDASITVTNATWADAIGSTDNDAAYAVAVDGSGNTIVGGVIRGSVTVAAGKTLVSAGGADWFVAKFDPAGNCLWANRMGGPADDAVDAITTDASGNVIVTGRFAGSASFGGTTNLVANGTNDMAVAKYGADGHHIWSKRFGGEYDDAPSAAAVDSAGNVYVTGYFRGTCDFGGGPLTVPFTSDLDVFILKLDAGGNHLWSKNFTNDGNERGYGIAVDGSGNVAITGYFSNSVNFGGTTLTSMNAMTDIFVARFTTAGVHSWSKRLGAPDGSEGGYGIAMDSSGNVLVTGYAVKAVDFGGGSLSALGGSDAFVAKYAATSGAHVWSRRIGGAANDYGYGITVNPSTNDVYLTGSFEDTANFGGTSLTPWGTSDAFVAKYTSGGAASWARQLGGANADVGRAIDFTAGTLATSGYFSGSGSFESTALTSAGLADAYVVRVAP